EVTDPLTTEFEGALNLGGDLGESLGKGFDFAKHKMDEMRSAAGSLFDRMTDSVASFVTGAKDAFKQFAVSAIREITRVLLRLGLVKLFMSAIPGFGASGATGLAGFLGAALG